MKRTRRSLVGLVLLLTMVFSLSLNVFAASPKINKKKATLYVSQTL